MLSIGLMSGTSMDGIDAALLKTDGLYRIQDLAHESLNYDPLFTLLLKSAEYAIRHYKGHVENAEQNYLECLHHYLKTDLQLTHPDAMLKALHQYLNPLSLHAIIQHSTDLHATVVKKLLEKTGLSASDITVVGYHGQTFFHQPKTKISVILGDAPRLSKTVRIPVVYDFRQQDIDAGGQGAPFAPLYHQALAVRDKIIPLAVVNCGGIANVTFITGPHEQDIVGFDTGPGNNLIDRLVRQRTNATENCDYNGHYGRKGTVQENLLPVLYQKSVRYNGENAFDIPPPRALDVSDLILIPELNDLAMEDACATLEAFTADSIVKSLDWINRPYPTHWAICGGGWYNPVILAQFKVRLHEKLGPAARVETVDQIGWNSKALEAQIFAYFAVRHLKDLPLSLPTTTGVKTPMPGGRLYTYTE